MQHAAIFVGNSVFCLDCRRDGAPLLRGRCADTCRRESRPERVWAPATLRYWPTAHGPSATAVSTPQPAAPMPSNRLYVAVNRRRTVRICRSAAASRRWAAAARSLAITSASRAPFSRLCGGLATLLNGQRNQQPFGQQETFSRMPARMPAEDLCRGLGARAANSADELVLRPSGRDSGSIRLPDLGEMNARNRGI